MPACWPRHWLLRALLPTAITVLILFISLNLLVLLLLPQPSFGLTVLYTTIGWWGLTMGLAVLLLAVHGARLIVGAIRLWLRPVASPKRGEDTEAAAKDDDPATTDGGRRSEACKIVIFDLVVVVVAYAAATALAYLGWVSSESCYGKAERLQPPLSVASGDAQVQMELPRGFKLGAATSAYQSEGGLANSKCGHATHACLQCLPACLLYRARWQVA